MLGEGGEVVTRQPYRKVWLDHLLSKVFNNTLYTGNRIRLKMNTTRFLLLFSVQRNMES